MWPLADILVESRSCQLGSGPVTARRSGGAAHESSGDDKKEEARKPESPGQKHTGSAEKPFGAIAGRGVAHTPSLDTPATHREVAN